MHKSFLSILYIFIIYIYITISDKQSTGDTLHGGVSFLELWYNIYVEHVVNF